VEFICVEKLVLGYYRWISSWKWPGECRATVDRWWLVLLWCLFGTIWSSNKSIWGSNRKPNYIVHVHYIKRLCCIDWLRLQKYTDCVKIYVATHHTIQHRRSVQLSKQSSADAMFEVRSVLPVSTLPWQILCICCIYFDPACRLNLFIYLLLV
jgi:hypothetical protein